MEGGRGGADQQGVLVWTGFREARARPRWNSGPAVTSLRLRRLLTPRTPPHPFAKFAAQVGSRERREPCCILKQFPTVASCVWQRLEPSLFGCWSDRRKLWFFPLSPSPFHFLKVFQKLRVIFQARCQNVSLSSFLPSSPSLPLSPFLLSFLLLFFLGIKIHICLRKSWDSWHSLNYTREGESSLTLG